VARLLAWLLLLLVLLGACSGTTAVGGLTPVTGIIIRADSLVSGHGCGRGPGQVYKYVAVVVNADGTPVAGAVYDCFADGAFVNLGPSDAGSLDFTVDIFAYSYDAYCKQDGCGDAGVPGQPGAIENAAGSPAALQSLSPTWTTTCRATQQLNIEVLAVCDPFPGLSITLRTAVFGTGLSCGGKYRFVKVLYAAKDAATGATTPGNLGETKCPEDVVLSDPIAPATYTFDVVLKAADDATVVGTTTCTATTIPGVPATATCAAVDVH
jgi:hypothetical protein